MTLAVYLRDEAGSHATTGIEAEFYATFDAISAMPSM
jgi:hypothetical protein